MRSVGFWYLVFLAAFCVAVPQSVAAGSALREDGKVGKSKKKKKKKNKSSKKKKKKKGKKGAAVFEPFDKIVELNGPAIFGGTVTLKGERLEILYNREGQFPVGFEGKDMWDTKSPTLSEAFKGMIKEVNGLVVFGLGKGVWTSRFPIAGDVWVEFGLGVPNLIGTQSHLSVRINWNKRKRQGWETSFFQTISYLSRGRPKGRQATKLKEYEGLPHRWFPRTGGSVPVAFGLRDGAMVSRIKSKDVVKVSAKKVKDKGGKIAFVFSELTYTIGNLRIRGKVDREWCEEKLAELKKAGKLKVPPSSTTK